MELLKATRYCSGREKDFPKNEYVQLTAEADNNQCGNTVVQQKCKSNPNLIKIPTETLTFMVE